MTATPETTRTVPGETPHHFLIGVAQQGDYALGFAKAGRVAEALEHADAIERLLAAYRTAVGAPAASEPAVDPAVLRERIIQALLAPRYGGPQHNNPGGLRLTATREEARQHRAGQIADTVMAVLPDRSALMKAHVALAEQAGRDQAKLAKLGSMHRPRTERPDSCCVQCGIVWPCPTSRVLDGGGE